MLSSGVIAIKKLNFLFIKMKKRIKTILDWIVWILYIIAIVSLILRGLGIL